MTNSFFDQFGLKRIINASGKMTALGASAVTEEVANALKAAAQSYVDMDELIEYAGKVIAHHTGAEDGCPTNGAATGIVISTAAVIAGKNISLIERMPNSGGLKNEIIIQKGQNINFGGNIDQMIRMGGGQVIEVGSVNKVEIDHIGEAITDKTAALIYIKSHHAVQKGMQSIESMIKIAQKHHIPLMIDGAAESDFQKYIEMGADVVIYSGGKALGGPTSGFISGKRQLMEACREQYKGIGRAMKVGKESIAGLIVALNQYPFRDTRADEQFNRMKAFCKRLNEVEGLTGTIHQDEAGRRIYRARIEVQKQANVTAEQLLHRLESGKPGIYLRAHYANVGILFVDPRPLLAGQEDIIAERIIAIIKEEGDDNVE
ncbi:L-seryl-tRNA(Ser) seleniumtransferase/D-glucosaminate-6-phosphate ammonia-lyase [Virgibacillus halotolerans]|uniref:DgaE family pyridoxal phosphate-dependent ammonia lyase n=1 Tax=Virgibacillus halotolerans TaxID=1071053 RepID=UPI001961CA6E|nr:DgaE family pyridoxal phosphate-dependent ammonia lyase [Virgibacillus halotolerans]MBM7599022.1 L-seryl-tRNA(Ser) seleniumtransferase/D-glucosaminate-6-phosphate ammonia-lyase [Virgibacillus halotolerans]